MRQLTSLIWKEWREVRVYLWIAMGVFVGLPVVGGIEELYQHVARHFEINSSPWVVIFGGVLAIFVAVGATCRDFSGPLEDFWRSRPVGVLKWLMVKYFVGLAVVIVACVLPLALELEFSREKIALVFIAWLPFLWAALYSMGFLAGCVLRRTAHAAMLGLAAMLLVYFLPMVLPPLEWMNVADVADIHTSEGSRWPDLWLPGQRRFGEGMLVLTAVVLGLALVAALRGWRIESGRKMMYGSVSAAFLILFASAAFQLGTNLPILQQVNLPGDETAIDLRVDGNRGYVMTQRLVYAGKFPNNVNQIVDIEEFYRPFELKDSGIELGPKISSGGYWGRSSGDSSPPQHPEIRYRLAGNDPTSSGKLVFTLWVHTPMEAGRGQLLWEEEFNTVPPSRAPLPCTYVWGNRLYVIGSHLVTFDISEPSKPQKISDIPFHYPDSYMDLRGVDRFILAVPPVPDLPPRERAQAAVKRNWGWQMGSFEGDRFCVWWDNLYEYQVKFSDAYATFEKIGEYEPTMLDEVFGGHSFDGMKSQNGLLYVSEGGGGRFFNGHISIFDTSGRQPLRLIGHFAAPGTAVVFPLPDGRAIVGGSKLWLVGPLPRRGSN